MACPDYSYDKWFNKAISNVTDYKHCFWNHSKYYVREKIKLSISCSGLTSTGAWFNNLSNEFLCYWFNFFSFNRMSRKVMKNDRFCYFFRNPQALKVPIFSIYKWRCLNPFQVLQGDQVESISTKWTNDVICVADNSK